MKIQKISGLAKNPSSLSGEIEKNCDKGSYSSNMPECFDLSQSDVLSVKNSSWDNVLPADSTQR